MRHRLFGKKLGRNHNERQSLLKNLAKSLFIHGSIETTDAKAKAVIPLVEKLCSAMVSKSEILAKRELGKSFQDRNLITAIYSNFKTVFADQKFNFTKTSKVKFRQGDNALIVKLSLVKPFSAKVTEVKETKK